MAENCGSRLWRWFGWVNLRACLGFSRKPQARMATLKVRRRAKCGPYQGPPGFVDATKPPADIDDSTVVLLEGLNEEDDTIVLIR